MTYVINLGLRLHPRDPDIIRIRIATHIQLDQNKQALDLLDKNDGSLFEKAYCLYRLNKLDQALSTVRAARTTEDISNNTATSYEKQRLIHLEAQIVCYLTSFSFLISYTSS